LNATDSAESNNRRIEFEDLDPSLKQLIKKSIKDGILTQSTRGIQVKTILIINNIAHCERIEYIKKHYLQQEIDFVEWILRTLNKSSIRRGRIYLAYDELQNKFSNPTNIPDQKSPDTNNDENGSADDFADLNRQKDFLKAKSTDPPGVSHHPLESSTDVEKEVEEFLDGPWEQLGVWRSDLARDHNFKAEGFIEPSQDLFKNLCKHYSKDPDYNSIFNNGSGWFTPITKDMGLSFKFSICKSGFVNAWFRSGVRLKDFYKEFFEQFKFLGLYYQELLKVVEFEKNKVFKLETANAIGDRDTVDEKLKGSHITVRHLYNRGKLHDIDIKIDFSVNEEPEIEFQGDDEEATRNLQIGVTNAVKVARFCGDVSDNLRDMRDTQLLQVQNDNDIACEISKNHSEIKNQIQEFSTQTTEQHTTLVQIMKENQVAVLEQFDIEVGEIQSLNNSVKFHSTEQLSSMQQHDLNNTLDHAHIESEIRSLKKKTLEKFDELKENITIIDDKIDSTNVKFKNNLYLVLRAIEMTPGKTVKSIHEELKIPQQTIYDYLDVLRRHNLVESKKGNDLIPKKGRPRLRLFRK
jgi:hypothetical protein